jgi:hypothetical protein
MHFSPLEVRRKPVSLGRAGTRPPPAGGKARPRAALADRLAEAFAEAEALRAIAAAVDRGITLFDTLQPSAATELVSAIQVLVINC